MKTVAGFVRCLATTAPPPRSVNPYALDAPRSALKRANLRLYLNRMLDSGTSMILVGEAPSYRGGRVTGVPFLSETLMLNGVKRSTLFGPGRGFRRATSLPRLSTEASATIVWGTIGGMDPPPLLWNAFPFHPFREGDQDTNRAPLHEEIVIGQPFLIALIRLFAIETVVAVGNHASRSLEALEIRHEKVRHPANGGKAKFVAGIRRVCQNHRR